VAHRLEKAGSALEDARILADGWPACVNRLYYACFHAVSALLLVRGLSAAKHSGVRSLFNRTYVKSGLVPRDAAKIFNDLFERRQESDYADFVTFEEIQVRPWLARAQHFVATVSALVAHELRQPEE
jgi:uncharacterized protein (UPF0332 family)